MTDDQDYCKHGDYCMVGATGDCTCQPATCNDPNREDVTKLQAKNLLHVMEKAELKRELEQTSEQLVFLNKQVEAMRKVVYQLGLNITYNRKCYGTANISMHGKTVDVWDEWRATQ